MTVLKTNLENEELQIIQCPAVNFSRLRIIKNIVVLCIAFFLIFTAYDCLSMLQSTLNHDEGIGVVCQSIIYGGFCLSSLLFPKYTIQKIGCKLTLVLSMCFYLPYIASNLYPHWSFMVPAATLNGLSASLLWAAQSIYLNEMAVLYAAYTLKSKEKTSTPNLNYDVRKKTSRFNTLTKDGTSNTICDDKSICSKVEKEIASLDGLKTFQNADDNETVVSKEIYCIKSKEKISNSSRQNNRVLAVSDIVTKIVIESTTARLFGIFGMAYLSTHAWSNLMSYFVLQNDSVNSHGLLNESCICGAHFCNEKSDCLVQNLLQPSEYTRNFLTGLCISLGLIAVLISAAFLESLNDKKDDVKFSLELVMATYEQTKKRKQILLIPLTFYVGMIQGFYTGDFTMSYVGCAWGTYHVSLVSVCYGACCAVSSPLSGWVMQRTGRPPIFFVTALVNIAAHVLLLAWKPTAESPMMFFLIAGLWGVSVGVLWSQLRAMYGYFFKDDEEAAFAAYHLWYSLGFCLSLAYSNHLCTYVKIYLLMAVHIVGMIGYLWVELLTRRQIKK